MKFSKLIIITILSGLFGIALAAPYQNQSRGQGGGQYNNSYQGYSAYQDNKPIDLFVQGSLGIAGNYSSSDADTYSESNEPSQIGGAASAEVGILLNINNQFVIGPTIGYMGATTTSKVSDLGTVAPYSLQLKTQVPMTNYGVLAGVKFAGGLGTVYLDGGYAMGGKETITLQQGNSKDHITTIDLDQAYMGLGGRYNVTPNLYVGMEYRAYNILNTTQYSYQHIIREDGEPYTIYKPINTSVGIFNLTFGMSL